LNKQLLATGALKKETDASATSDIKAIATKGKLTAAIDAEAAAQARLAAVIDKTIARQEAANIAAAYVDVRQGREPVPRRSEPSGPSRRRWRGARTMKAEVVEAEVATVGSFGRIKGLRR
jgi:hypothetical protein